VKNSKLDSLIVLVLEMIPKSEDEEENEHEDERKPGVFHTASSGGSWINARPDRLTVELRTKNAPRFRW